MKRANEDVTLSLVISPRKLISGADPASPVTFCIRPETPTLIFEAGCDFVSILMKVPRDGRLKMEADADEGEITFCTTMRFGSPTRQYKQTSANASLAFHKSGAVRVGADDKQETH